MDEQSVLITGGAGFIGSHLVEEFVNRGHDVTVLDDLSTGDRQNLRNVRDRIDFREIDLRSKELASVLEGVDSVFHQAALPSVPRSFERVIDSTDINVMGTVRLLEQARAHDVRKVVFASSSSVYGDREELPKVETMGTRPKSPYAASKVTCELFGEIFSESMGLEVVGLRYFNVFGPRQSVNSDYAAVVPNFVTALLEGERPVIYGDGEQSRDFTYVKDVVRANLLAMEEGKPGCVYNVGYNQQTTVNDLLYEIRRITGSQLEPRYEEERPGDVRHSRADASELRQDTGFEPEYTVEDGLRRTVEWFRENPDHWKENSHEG